MNQKVDKMDKKNSGLSDSIKTQIVGILISMVVMAITNHYTIRRSMENELLKLKLTVQAIENRYVEQNELEPVKEQSIENKNRINDNVEDIQRLSIEVEVLKD